jgi:Flp pilus assembly protein TadG
MGPSNRHSGHPSSCKKGSRKPVRATSIRRRRGRSVEQGREAGQSLVEFSLVLIPLFLILLGIIQFGFIFNTYVTMANAARDAARLGTVYEYDRTISKGLNDLARNESIKDALTNSMNMLSRTSPQFSTNGSTWSQSGSTFTNGDLRVTYVIPSGLTDSDSRVGEQITVRAVYHQDLVVPLIAALLPRDSNGRLGLIGEVTMVMN